MRRVVACLSAALLLSACSGEDGTTSPTPGASATAAVPVATAKPKVEIPKGAAPKELVKTDLKVGTGEAVIPGQVVSVHYVGLDYATGEEFDTSWDGSAFQFVLGNGDVIEGWDKGVVGMRVGGRRQLVIPPAMAYGEDPSAHRLGGKTLVFVVDVLGTGGRPAGAGS